MPWHVQAVEGKLIDEVEHGLGENIIVQVWQNEYLITPNVHQINASTLRIYGLETPAKVVIYAPTPDVARARNEEEKSEGTSQEPGKSGRAAKRRSRSGS